MATRWYTPGKDRPIHHMVAQLYRRKLRLDQCLTSAEKNHLEELQPYFLVLTLASCILAPLSGLQLSMTENANHHSRVWVAEYSTWECICRSTYRHHQLSSSPPAEAIRFKPWLVVLEKYVNQLHESCRLSVKTRSDITDFSHYHTC